MKKNLFLLLFISINGAYVVAQKPQKIAANYAKTITQADLKKHLTIIAADSMEGRDTGKPGLKKAGNYIAAHFKKIGLQPPVKTETGMSYFQPYNMVSRTWGEVYIKVGEQKLRFAEDFYALRHSLLQTETELSVVLAGNGENEAWKAQNLQDKAVVFIYPKGGDKEKELAEIAKKQGAKAVLILATKTQAEFAEAISYNAYYLKRPYQGLSGNKDNSVFYLSPASTARILQTTEDDLAQYTEKVGFAPAIPIKIKAEKNEKISFTAENVLGFLEGTDKKEEVLIITAHYDHVGMADGKVYNGADDDGSGTVSVMEIAEAFAKAKAEGKGPRRSILFMTVSGEEKGLYGSQFYTDFQPIFPLENTAADLNIDMVGRIGGEYIAKNDPNYIYLIGSDKLSTDLHKLSEKVNQTTVKLKLDYKYNDENDPNRFYYRSDHFNFAKHNIPIIFYFNGVHDDYHQPTDDVSKIHFPKMERIGRLIFYTAWEIANREERLKVDKK
jgi:hypothetical protein